MRKQSSIHNAVLASANLWGCCLICQFLEPLETDMTLSDPLSEPIKEIDDINEAQEGLVGTCLFRKWVEWLKGTFYGCFTITEELKTPCGISFIRPCKDTSIAKSK